MTEEKEIKHCLVNLCQKGTGQFFMGKGKIFCAFCYPFAFFCYPLPYSSVVLDKSLSVCIALDFVRLCRHPADFSTPHAFLVGRKSECWAKIAGRMKPIRRQRGILRHRALATVLCFSSPQGSFRGHGGNRNPPLGLWLLWALPK